MGYGMFEGEMNGIRNIRKMKRFRNIEHALKGYKPRELTGYGIFRPKIMGYGTQSPSYSLLEPRHRNSHLFCHSVLHVIRHWGLANARKLEKA